MKKFIKIVSALLFIALFGFLVYNNLNKNEVNVTATEAKDYYDVCLINGNENGGDIKIAIKEDDNYVDQEATSLQVKAGTKVKFIITLNQDYSVYCWTTVDNGYLAPTTSSSDESGFYTSTYFVKTINADLTLKVYAKKATDHVVTFYNSSVISSASIVDIAIASDGGSVNLAKVNTPTQKGFDFQSWSQELNAVSEDLMVYPNFTSNIWTVWRDYYPMFLSGLGVTLLLSVVSVGLALILGALVCLARMSNSIILKFIFTAYVEIIRGVPLLLQLLVVYIILGPTRISIGSFFTTEVISCLLALFINSSAYVSEIFRAGIQSVDKGQMEAGRALGLSKWKVMKKIVMPQGIRNSLPSIGNELVAMIKETSLAVSVDASIGELMSVRKNITAATYINLPPFIIVAIIYFIVTFSLSKLIRLLEKRLAQNED